MNKILTALILLLSSFTISAQSSIDLFISKMEHKEGIDHTYTEQREKGKLTFVTCILRFSEKKDFEKAVSAFEQERSKTTSAQKHNANTYIYRFSDDKGDSCYYLYNDDNTYLLVKKWISKDKDNEDEDEIEVDVDDISMLIPLQNGTITIFYNDLGSATISRNSMSPITKTIATTYSSK